MRRVSILLAAAFVFLSTWTDWTAAQEASLGATIQSMQWARRVVLLSAPDANDAQFVKQQRLLSEWPGMAERDVSVVQIAADQVVGAIDAAAGLRHRYHLPSDHFVVLLIGKDGHVALQSATALSAEELTHTIDAMPMRRAGER